MTIPDIFMKVIPLEIDISVLDKYKNYAEVINSTFYVTDRMNGKYKKYVTMIHDIFKKSPTISQQTTLYRGISNDNCDETYYPFRDTLLQNVGNDVCFQTFLSTSYNRDSALNFSDGILLKLTMQAGTKFIPIDYWLGKTGIDSEEEILLPHDLLFHIENVENIVINDEEYNVLNCHHIGFVSDDKYNLTK